MRKVFFGKVILAILMFVLYIFSYIYANGNIGESGNELLLEDNDFFLVPNELNVNETKTSNVKDEIYCIVIAITSSVAIIFFVLYIKTLNKNRKLLKRVEAKAEFFARMSHEIRSPLAAIIGMNSIAKLEIDNKEKMAEWVSKITISSNHILDIINDILDLERMNAGSLELRLRKTSVRDLSDMIKLIYTDVSKTSELEFNVSVSDDIDEWFYADGLRLKQVVMNLISNAIKYNREGGFVSFDIELVEDNDAFQIMKFIITDSGIGISKESLPYIFNAYSRENRKETDLIYGSGLGLNIAYKMTELMGGKIEVESQYGKGSVFSFTLKLDKYAEEECNEDSDHIDLREKNVLVAEDNEINSIIMQNILSKYGANPVMVSNGEFAVEAFRKSSDGYFDFILMDIRMPIMGGYEATNIIRKMDRKDAKTVKIIALSANAFSDDIANSFDNGMNGHLTKPLNLTEFKMVIKDMLK